MHEGRRLRGQHGKRGESKALVVLEILKSSFEMFNYAKAKKLFKEEFVPVSRSDLKWKLKTYNNIKKKMLMRLYDHF